MNIEITEENAKLLKVDIGTLEGIAFQEELRRQGIEMEGIAHDLGRKWFTVPTKRSLTLKKEEREDEVRRLERKHQEIRDRNTQ